MHTNVSRSCGQSCLLVGFFFVMVLKLKLHVCCVGLGNFRSIQIVLATQNLRDAVREVLSSCSLPLDYVDTVAALQLPGSHSGLSQSQNYQFSQTVRSSILERFYGFGAHDQPHIRVRQMARDSLRLLACCLLQLCYFTPLHHL